MQIDNNKNIATCKSATWKSVTRKKKYNMKIVQYEESATWRRYNLKIVQHKKVQHGKIATEKSATWKRCNMKKSVTWKECNTKKVQPEKSA